jgi:putative lipoprotein
MMRLAAPMTGAGLLGCSGAPPPGQTGAGPASEPATWVYSCPDGFRFSARMRGDSVTIAFMGGSEALTRVASRSGRRYESQGATFQVRHDPADDARLETGMGSHDDCRGVRAGTPWEEAALLGIEFRAIGQEPGWALDLGPGRWLRFTGDYGEMRVLVAAPAPVRDSSSGMLTYRVRAGMDTLVVTTLATPCQDVMSGEAFSHEVTVRIGSLQFSGCGRPLATGDLVSAYWQLLDVGGAPAVAPLGEREVHLRFPSAGRQIRGSTGCNALSAPVVLDRQRMRIGAIVATRMACPTLELSTQERELIAALEATDRFTVADGHLTLYGGDRRLARFVAVYLR